MGKNKKLIVITLIIAVTTFIIFVTNVFTPIIGKNLNKETGLNDSILNNNSSDVKILQIARVDNYPLVNYYISETINTEMQLVGKYIWFECQNPGKLPNGTKYGMLTT